MTAVNSLKKPGVGILGAGTQGRRLAYMWSKQGKDVYLIDPDESQLKTSLVAISELRSHESGIDHVTTVSRQGNVISQSLNDLKATLQDCWLVVECLPERLSLKQDIIAQLDRTVSCKTIIASNSSSYTCSDIVDGLDLRHEDRILSAHTYWPPECPVIEIMGHAATSQSHIQTLVARSRDHGFQPFHVRKPSMGYLYNRSQPDEVTRIWAAIKREALLTAAEGVGTPAEIDSIFRTVLKTSKGPFEQMDVVGLDVVYDIEQHYADTRPGIPTAPRDYLSQYLAKGDLGVKTGKGFFWYDVDK